MAKPRILIVDTDMNYIIPLQQKFVKDYYEKIDLEIISDRNYGEQFFGLPQKADILIISEELYSPVIRRHDIENIFVMTEQRSEDHRIVDSNVFWIYKYTNINDVFSAITGKCREILSGTDSTAVKTKIIVIYAAGGGVGKTTIALGISACLNESHKRVLYMNADHLQTFQIMLENKSPIAVPEVYARLSNADEKSYSEIKHTLRNEGFVYIPPFKASLMSLNIKYAVFEKIAVSAKQTGDYDYIIIDSDAAFDEDKTRLLDIADKVIIVTRQSKVSVYATNILVSNINEMDTDKYVFVCNDFDESMQNYLILPDILKKFDITEYVGHLSNYSQLKTSDLAREGNIQKIAYFIS